MEKGRSSAFLDIDVYRGNITIETSVHQYIKNQHFLEFIPTTDPLLQLSIKVV